MYGKILETAKVIVLTKNDDGTFKLESDIELSNNGEIMDAKVEFGKVVPHFDVKADDNDDLWSIYIEDNPDDDDQYCERCGNDFTFCECDRVRR